MNIGLNYTILMGVARKSVAAIEEFTIRIPFISRFYWRIAPLVYSKWKIRREDVKKPVFERKHISPESIRFYSGLESWFASEGSIRKSIGVRRDCDWDQGEFREVFPYLYEDSIRDLSKVRLNDLLLPSFRERFKNNKSWEETLLWEYIMEKIKSGEILWHNCENIKDVQNRFTNMDKLYKSMKSGYKSQIELSKTGEEYKRFLDCIRNEILVDKGRDGQLLFVDGIHRLAMSRLLDIEKITVIVLSHHSRFNHS